MINTPLKQSKNFPQFNKINTLIKVCYFADYVTLSSNSVYANRPNHANLQLWRALFNSLLYIKMCKRLVLRHLQLNN